MTDHKEPLYDEAYLEYQRDRSPFRKWVRQFYIRHALKHLITPAIDFGCGIGEHLTHLGSDSIGIEVNESSVAYCQNKGLNVVHVSPNDDLYQLSFLEKGKYNSMLISHVLEHLDNPDEVLRQLLIACERIGVKRIFICVPGKKGYAHDATHRTFIDLNYIQDHGLNKSGAFQLVKSGYFPFNAAFVGNYFTHNETYLMYDRV